MIRPQVQRHARAVLDHELARARARLGRLAPERRRAVEETSFRVTVALVDGLLEEARREPSLSRALTSIYPEEPRWEARAAPVVAD